MANLFKNKSVDNIGTSFITLYDCNNDDIPYIIIAGMTISNKILNEITISVRIVDSTNLVTAYLLTDSKLSVGSSLAFAGDLQKIILKKGDKMEMNCSEADASLVNMSIIEHNTEFAYYGPIETWFGDKGYITSGENYYDHVDKFWFSSKSVNAGFISLIHWTRYTPGGTSNGILGLLVGGYENGYPYSYGNIKSFEFASDIITDNYSSLMTGVYYISTSSNGTIHLTGGGYSYTAGRQSAIQQGTFDSGTTSTYFGNMYGGMRQDSCSGGNSTTVIWSGGYYYTNNVSYSEYATEANAQLWGTYGYNYRYQRTATNEEIFIMTSGYSSTNRLFYTEFASQANIQIFGYLNYSNYELGGCSNGITALFMCGENYNYSYEIDFSNQSGTTQFANWGFTNFDGGQAAAFSGIG